jgi:hypothetical protein
MKDSVDGRNSFQVNREPDVDNGGNGNRPFPPGEDDQPPTATGTARTDNTSILMPDNENDDESSDESNSVQVNGEPNVDKRGNGNRPFPPGEDDQPPPATRTGRTDDTIILMEQVESDDESS